MSRVACVRVPFFAAAAAERAEPVLRERPVAVVRGAPPGARVVEANTLARAAGVRPGVADAAATARCPGLVRRAACDQILASARHALLEAALAVSPRVEDGGPGVVYVDTAGLGRLFGDADAIARRLLRQVRGIGLAAQVGIASTRVAARLAAATAAGGPNVIPPGRERDALAAISLDAVELPEELAATLARWGVRTLGELAALPRDTIAMRLGPAGLRAHDVASGRDDGPFHLYVLPPYWEEAQGLEWEVDSLDGLVAVLAAMLGRLCARLGATHLAADALAVRLRLATGGRHDRTVTLAAPMREATPMLALARLALEAHPPPAPVVAVAVEARPVARRPGQGRLGQPAPPASRDLATVLARLRSLVGSDNVGSPRLEDVHRPDAFTLAPLTLTPTEEDVNRHSDVEARDGSNAARAAGEVWRGCPTPSNFNDGCRTPSNSLILRRLRPPRRVVVELDGERPATVNLGTPVAPATPVRVVACAGPWRGSGEWWDARAWARDEWDVALGDRTLCRLAHDRIAGEWYLDGAYD